jgi:hypothetical protein
MHEIVKPYSRINALPPPIIKDKIMTMSREYILRLCVLDCNYKFPEELKASGVMFYLGERITQKEFKKLAREMK